MYLVIVRHVWAFYVCSVCTFFVGLTSRSGRFLPRVGLCVQYIGYKTERRDEVGILVAFRCLYCSGDL